ncbi:malto-oligosyltrehalose trehalohydrolase [Roseivivax halodurans JCM 10272]|uniref:Malto-oligosyltrehalose trehalohydrolase n=1 Tax=Roseivivax halodurans JCM 10272 TaxID=1449350 RepID=X7EGN2_9RHOB|nr:malto-oligosyltrehalose trehalohydrolase [Roseivivax halodurans]ETX14268.1 malto-oligosyltrehalose trehalohydrolase [Roseivivax halodurans JCM 10272]
MSDLPAWGAVPLDGTRTRFRLWAPGIDTLGLRLPAGDVPMSAAGDGWFEFETEAPEGTPYNFVLPDGMVVPDPASRRQESDVHGPSLVTAAPKVATWPGRPWEEAVIYELHVGTFSDQGTFQGAIEHLAPLKDLGVTAIELMPVAHFPGSRGWGYDGVLTYAPHPAYGSPDDLRALVEAAHRLGMMVLLDVVYNHFGPDGNYLHAYAPSFFDEDRHTPWGAGIDYARLPVRRFFIENAIYWLEAFGLDGLRLDAVDQIRDASDPELLVEIAREIRARVTDRPIHLTTEDNRNVTHLHWRTEDGSVPLFTAEWNDDFHNAAHVCATGETEGYYGDFARGHWDLLARSLAEGFAYQGEATLEGAQRGEPSGHLPPAAFVDFLQNHDQIGNRAFGERLSALTSESMMEAMTAILLLSPHIPLMFMGDEYGETRPFCFFTDFEGELGRAVTEGRRREFADFAAFASGDTSQVPDPIDRATFLASTLDRSRRETPEGRARLDLTRRLLQIRSERIVPLLGGARGHAGRVLLVRDGALAVDWQLGGAVLQLRANLSETPCDLPAPEGTEIHSIGGLGAPHSVQHWLREAS